jgi:hypothetical protein
VGLLAEALGVLIIALSLRSSDLLSVFLVGSEILFNLVAIVGLTFLWGSWGRKARSGTPDSALLVRMNGAFRGQTILLGGLTGIAAMTGLFSAVAFHAAGAGVMGLWATLYSLTGGAAVVTMLVRSRRDVRAIATALGIPLA